MYPGIGGGYVHVPYTRGSGVRGRDGAPAIGHAVEIRHGSRHVVGRLRVARVEREASRSTSSTSCGVLTTRRGALMTLTTTLTTTVLSSTGFLTLPTGDALAAGGLVPLRGSALAGVLEALEETIPASKAPLMLRLIFHDGATYRMDSKTGGVNGSIQYELDRPENFGLKRGTNVIRQLKEKLPSYSVADLIVLSAAYAVKVTNGPDMFGRLRVGRSDATGADPAGRMPEETLSADEQVEVFAAMGFSVTEMVALLGSHTIGQKGFGGPLSFDNVYYQSLLKRPWENKDDKMASMIGLASDRVLPENEAAKEVIVRFAADQPAFFEEFEAAFLKLSERGCV